MLSPRRVRLFCMHDHKPPTPRTSGGAPRRARGRILIASPRAFLESLFRTAVAAAPPEGCLRPHLPAAPAGRLLILAAGKAAASMSEVAERHYLDACAMPADRIGGLAVTRR